MQRRSHPIAAVGDYESVLPFQAIGLKQYAIDDPNDEEGIRRIMLDMINEKFAICLMTEDLYQRYEQLIDELTRDETLSVIPIPTLKHSTGYGTLQIRNWVERAVGIDIFANK